MMLAIGWRAGLVIVPMYWSRSFLPLQCLLRFAPWWSKTLFSLLETVPTLPVVSECSSWFHFQLLSFSNLKILNHRIVRNALSHRSGCRANHRSIFPILCIAGIAHCFRCDSHLCPRKRCMWPWRQADFYRSPNRTRIYSWVHRVQHDLCRYKPGSVRLVKADRRGPFPFRYKTHILIFLS